MPNADRLPRIKTTIELVSTSIVVLGLVAGGTWGFIKPKVQEAITEQVSHRVANLEQRDAESTNALAERITSLEAKIELDPELRSLIALKCMGQERLNFTINRLKVEYMRRTGEEYSEPSCARLTLPN